MTEIIHELVAILSPAFPLVASLIFAILTYLLLDFICMKIYFKSGNFISVKDELREDITNFNQWVSYVEAEKNKIFPRWIYYYKKIDGKTSQLSSLLNTQVNIHNCSASVCKQAQNAPIKYLCKYFNFAVDDDTLAVFEGIQSDCYNLNTDENDLVQWEKDILDAVKETMPVFHRKAWIKASAKELGLQNATRNSLHLPQYLFLYTSAKGKSSLQQDIVLDYITITQLVDYLRGVLDSKSEGQRQRSLMTPELRRLVKERDNYSCVRCGISIEDEPHLLLEIDHIIPISKGGKSAPENLQTLCWECNRSKGSKT